VPAPNIAELLCAITDAALALDPADRLELASLLIESVEGSDQDEAWTQAWTQELNRRSAAADARSERGRP
jgi:hypothetical protein